MELRFGMAVGITRLLLQVGALCANTGKFEDGERIVRAVRAFSTDVPQVSMALVLLLVRQGRWREALFEQQQASNRFPDSPVSRTLLALIQRQLGNPDWQDELQQALSANSEEWRAALDGASLQHACERSSGSLPSRHVPEDSLHVRRIFS